MGAFLAKRLKWAAPNRLDDTEDNIVTFKLVYRRLELLCRAIPDIGNIPFEPFTFESVIIPADFRGLVGIDDKISIGPMSIESSAVDPRSNIPLYVLEQTDSSHFTARIASLESLVIHLSAAGERLHRDVKRLLEAYPNPVAAMVGLKDVDPADLILHQYAIIESLSKAGEGEGLKQARQRLALLLAVHQLEILLVSATLDRNSRVGPSITVSDVKRQMRLLQLYSGSAPLAPLISISWEGSTIRYSSGARAPPWRQARGELCYVVAETKDAGQLVITCARDGFFVNRGLFVETKGSTVTERINYERAGKTYPSLVALLRAHSSHFNEHVDSFVPVELLVPDETSTVELSDADSEMTTDAVVHPSYAKVSQAARLMGKPSTDRSPPHNPVLSRVADRPTSRPNTSSSIGPVRARN